MKEFSYPNFATRHGYMSEQTQRAYIAQALKAKLLPVGAHRMADIISLEAPNDPTQPIQFWQLFSVLGPQLIINLTKHFYERVFWDEEWFRQVFAAVGPVEHHVNTQASMWADVMGGGPYYHGAEFRLKFHHHHNAMALMNDKGARRWADLMRNTLDELVPDQSDDPRVRPALNTFLTFFFSKYAEEFNFKAEGAFGDTNPPVTRRINLRNMTQDAIEALDIDDLRVALNARSGDMSDLSKSELVARALRL